MKIQLDEQRGSLRVESNGAVVLDLENFPVVELKVQLRAWLRSVDDTSAPVFIFRSDNPNFGGTFRIEPRPERWQFTSWKERVRSPELLSLEEWRQVLRQSGV
jgi:hypothetical protein